MKRILLTEDDNFIRDMVASKLKQHEYRISTAGSGEAAIQSLRESTPDVLLLDLALPDMEGVELLEYIRNDTDLTKIPVIIFSNNDDTESREKTASYGISAYFVKVDTELDKLVEKINEVVSS